MHRLPLLLAAFLAASVARLPAAAAPATPAAPDKKQAAVRTASDRVFDLSKLHVIDIVISDEGVRHLVERTETRYRCTVTFDGEVLTDVGVRQAGGEFHPYQPVTGKPSLSLKFNEFVKGQRLQGLERLILKNQIQDQSLLNEHLTYEVFRRAGLPAALTAYALVTLNGNPAGIYLMREAVGDDFMVRNFGSANADGNLYQLEFRAGDFARNPRGADLNDEVKDKRTRTDLIDLAAVLTAVPDEFFVQASGPMLDLDRSATYFAVETITSHVDGISFRNNNTYLYHLPSNNRFVIIPYGADAAFWATEHAMFQLSNPYQLPPSALARKFRTVPALLEKYRAELVRVSTAPVWDEAALLARVEQVARLLAPVERKGRAAQDLARFEAGRPIVEDFIRRHGTAQNGRAL